MPHPNKVPTYSEIRSMSEDELVECIDVCLKSINISQSYNNISINLLSLIQIYRDELAKREQDRATQAMLGYTRKMTCMTVIVTVSTILGLIVSGISLYISLHSSYFRNLLNYID